MQATTIIGLLVFSLLFLLEIRNSKRNIKKEYKLKEYLSFRSKASSYDFFFSIATIFSSKSLYDKIVQNNTIIYAISIIIGIAFIYFGSRYSRYFINKRFYNKTPMFY
ncbi:MAG: hypothetical protein DRI86_15870 [Bacteroidetes bacterium]|nr:MAG: hypothetical protein DRI86_15870 [Bacteroidota bacterium]